jgi:hypothetical protein
MKEVIVIKRRRAWEWQLRDQGGILIMGGRERTRPAARYQGYRTLFMLLASSWRSSASRPLKTLPIPKNSVTRNEPALRRPKRVEPGAFSSD